MQRVAAVLLLVWAATTSAQGPAPRALGPVVASTGAVFTTPSFTRALSDGRLMVLDGRQRIVVLYDSALKNPRIVIDSAPGKKNSFGAVASGPGGSMLSAMPGDSTLFFDRASESFLVLDPRGEVARVQPGPPGLTPSVMSTLTSLENGMAVVAPGFGLVYRLSLSSAPRAPAGMTEVTIESKNAVLAMNLATRALDTLAKISSGYTARYTFDANGRSTTTPWPAQFTSPDGWAVLSDGTLAIIHGREYRIEWVNPDRTRTQSGRIPHPWKPFTESEKARIVDSTNAQQKAQYESGLARRAADSAAGGLRGTVNAAGLAVAGRGVIVLPPRYIDASMLPDFYPAIARITAGRAWAADADNNLWVLINHPESNATTQIYDVIDRKGVLIDRVKIPEGRVVLGFGPRGAVYLTAIDGGKRLIEKARFN
jgi:hypothetical protein